MGVRLTGIRLFAALVLRRVVSLNTVIPVTLVSDPRSHENAGESRAVRGDMKQGVISIAME